jgi:hypothetical protein
MATVKTAERISVARIIVKVSGMEGQLVLWPNEGRDERIGPFL